MDEEKLVRGFAIVNKVPYERVQDLICCAMEGGIGYWATIVGYENPDGVEVEFAHNELPLTERGAVLLEDCVHVELDAEDRDRWRLDKQAIHRGLKIMARKYPKPWADFLNENEDAETGDVLIQLALFGTMVYG